MFVVFLIQEALVRWSVFSIKLPEEKKQNKLNFP